MSLGSEAAELHILAEGVLQLVGAVACARHSGINMFEDFRLRVFMTVESCGSFTAAARELGVSQPAVSQNIAELEKLAGAPLFARGRGEVTLTEKGRLFKEYAAQILHWYKAAEEAMESSDKDSLCERTTIEIGNGRSAEIWGSQGDLHLKIK